jgi:hypothetical protein
MVMLAARRSPKSIRVRVMVSGGVTGGSPECQYFTLPHMSLWTPCGLCGVCVESVRSLTNVCHVCVDFIKSVRSPCGVRAESDQCLPCLCGLHKVRAESVWSLCRV